jgi:hypothetical protein
VVTQLVPFHNNGSAVDGLFLNMQQTDYEEISEPYYQRAVIPISFVIPDRLPFDPCSGEFLGASGLRQDHVQLPPSMHYERDPSCPEMCSIFYYLYADVDLGCGKRLCAKKQVRVLPLYPERPPRLWEDGSNIRLSDTTALRTTMLAASVGQLKLHASQPKSMFLPTNGPGGPGIASIHLYLDIDGLEAPSKLPRSCQIRAILEVVTYWSTKAMTDMPDMVHLHNSTDVQVFRSSVCLRKNKSVGLKWVEKNGGAENSRQAALIVPVVLPGNTGIVPTFYHCYASREYFMRIELVVGKSRTLRLKLPLQIYNSLGH